MPFFSFNNSTNDIVSLECESCESCEIREHTETRYCQIIPDKFKIANTYDFNRLFSQFRIGVGTKYTFYYSECFMKERVEEKKPDFEGLPHIMTLIFKREDVNLKVCGKNVTGKTFFLTLDCSYEVLPKSHNGYSIYTFPVYGIYKGLNVKPCKSGITVHSQILKYLETGFEKNVYEVVRLLYNVKMNRLAFRLKKLHRVFVAPIEYDEFDEESDEEESMTVAIISYTDENGIQVERKIDSKTYIPFLNDMTIKTLSEQEILVERLKNRVANHQKVLEEEYKNTVSDSRPISFQLPDQPFIIVLDGIYHGTSTIENLVEKDTEIYKFLTASGRQVSFVPNTLLYSIPKTYIFSIDEDGKFVNYTTSRIFDPLSVDYIQRDYDDDEKYKYNMIKGVLVVNY